MPLRDVVDDLADVDRAPRANFAAGAHHHEVGLTAAVGFPIRL